MRFRRIPIFLSIVALSAGTAWPQFGLYGSPEILSLTQVDPGMGPYGGKAMPAAYPPARAAATGYARPLIQTAAADPDVGIPMEPAPPAAPGATAGPSPAYTAAPGCQSGMPSAGCCEPCLPDCCGQPMPDCCGGGDCGGCLSRAVRCFEQKVLGCGDDCGDGCGCTSRACSPWYASACALVMGRNDPNRLWTSYETGNEAHQLTHTQDIELRWRWGGEIRFGRRFCCGQRAWEATYWTLDEFSGFVSTTHPNCVSTPLTVSHIQFNGNPATNWFDNAEGHRLWRTNEFQNVELNLIRNRFLFANDSPWEVDWSMGVRFFRFEERLTFGAVANGYAWGQDPSCEAYLTDRIINNLIGFQFGFNADYFLSQRCRLFVSPTVGIYGNHMNNYFHAYLGDGTGATQSYYPGTYPVRSSKNGVSFLTEVDLGVDWQFSQRWSARIGYRLLATTGVGLADEQFPPYIVDIPEIRNIDHNGDLVLHGAFVGVTYNF